MLLVKIVILQTIIFGIVLYFLKKIMWGDTESAVNRLNESYEEIRKKKEELTKLLAEMEAEYKKRKEEADKISLQIIDKAKEEGGVKKDEMLKIAKKEAEDIIAKAMSTIDNIRKEIDQQTQLKAIDFCADILKVILTRHSAGEVHEIFVKEFIEELNGLDMGKIGTDVNKIDIISCKALEDKYKDQIKKIISGKLKREINISESIDAGLLGGLLVKFGGLALDGSFSGKLKEAVAERKKMVGQ